MVYSPADFCLAILEHFTLFALVGLLALKIASIRPNLTAWDIGQSARAAAWYGTLLAVDLSAGLSRVLFADGGWTRHAGNIFYWAKLSAFLVVVFLAILPTLMISRWRRDIEKFPTSTPCLEDVLVVRRYLWLEAAGLALVVVFGAALAHCFCVDTR
jgi:putative membrane protein